MIVTDTLFSSEKKNNMKEEPDFPLDHSMDCTCGNRDCPVTFLKEEEEIKLTGDEESIAHAKIIRNALIPHFEKVLPTLQELTEDQRNTILNKVKRIVATEHRSTYFINIELLTYFTKLTPLLKKWAGIIKVKPIGEKTKKIGYAENGRVLKTGKSL